MSEFYQVFFEEAGELLGNMEQLLLDLDIGSPDAESLAAVFRVAHSIKGGAATFGFADMAEVTHVLESLLDQIRKGEKRLRPEMIDVFLAAGDVLKGQLAGHRGDGSPDAAAAARVCAQLKEFVAAADQTAPSSHGAAAVAATPKPAASPVKPVKSYRVEFSLGGAPAETASLLGHVLRGLEGLGALQLVRGSKQGGELHAENGKARQLFDGTLSTAASEEDIWEVLAFNLDPAAVKVSAGAAPQPAANKGVAEEGEDYGLFQTLYDAVVPPEPAKAPAPAQPAAAPAPKAVEGPPRSPGRRTIDDPEVTVAKAGRRDNDKVAVSASGGGDATSIRVNIEKVDHLINLVGELVIAQAMLAQTASKVDPVTGEALMQNMTQLERNMRDLQEGVMSIRMMPIGFVFSRFPRVVRDLAAKLNKQVELKTTGEGTELDKGLIEKISDPLTHLVRNSLDHGVELPQARVARGKPEKGTITLRAFHQGGSIVIEVSDDGAGLNREKILAKARERRIAVSDAMSDQEVWQLIFEAGFSTADVVTDVSGRGVGMDVVKRNIQALGGSVEIQSQLNVGTTMSIRVPLTLAILDGMSIAVGGETFIVPLTAIVESLRPRRGEIESVQGMGEVVRVRGEFLPIVRLHEVFGIRSRIKDIEQGLFMILEADGGKKAVLVDELLGQHQVVIKSLETNYRKTPGVSGATIMGDGRVALILDVASILRMPVRALRVAA